MYKNNFGIFYDAPETGGSGGTVEVPAEPTVEKPAEPNTPAATEPAIPAEPTVEKPAEPNTPAATEENFNPDEINFDGSQTGDFDINQMSFLADEGFDIADESLVGNIKEINALGVTDPQVIANFIRKASEATKEPTAAEIKETLNKELSPELKANYSSLNNTLKSAWGNNEELKPLIGAFMSTPKAIGAINALVQHLRGGVDPNPSTGNVPRTSQGLTMDKAIKSFDEQWSESIRKNGSGKISDKMRIVNEISSKMNPTEVKEFRSRYE